MLINIRTSELQSNTSNSVPLTIIVGIVISYFLFQLLPYGILISSHLNDSNLNQNIYSLQGGMQSNSINGINTYKNDLFFLTSKIWDANLAENNHITSIGNVLYTNYNIWLFLASFILLLAMVGAIVITIKPNTTSLAGNNEYNSRVILNSGPLALVNSNEHTKTTKRYYSSLGV